MIMLTELAPYFTSIIAGLVAYLAATRNAKIELEKVKLEFRTEFRAEETARHFLRHEGYTDRSFETLRTHLGGFEDDELRKILVRAGAIRTIRKDGTEWWRLLDRMDEYIENKKGKAD